MKKILLTLFLIFGLTVTSAVPVFADDFFGYEENSSTSDWLFISNDERKARVVEVFKIMFPKGYVTNFPKAFLQTKLKSYLKNKNHKIHYQAVCSGYTHYRNVDLQPFVMGNNNFVYMYALQYTKTPQRTYYYDASGNLKFVDFRYGNYPNYPFYTKKYSINGKLVRAMYLLSPDTMYIFGEKGNFIGYKHQNEVYGFNFDPSAY